MAADTMGMRSACVISVHHIRLIGALGAQGYAVSFTRPQVKPLRRQLTDRHS